MLNSPKIEGCSSWRPMWFQRYQIRTDVSDSCSVSLCFLLKLRHPIADRYLSLVEPSAALTWAGHRWERLLRMRTCAQTAQKETLLFSNRIRTSLIIVAPQQLVCTRLCTIEWVKWDAEIEWVNVLRTQISLLLWTLNEYILNCVITL